MSYYDVLGVTVDAAPSELKKAYHDLALLNHPDKFTDAKQKEQAEQRMKQINVAYDFLKDEVSRREYDLSRGIRTDVTPARQTAEGKKNSRDGTLRSPRVALRAEQRAARREKKRQANIEKEVDVGVLPKLDGTDDYFQVKVTAIESFFDNPNGGVLDEKCAAAFNGRIAAMERKFRDFRNIIHELQMDWDDILKWKLDQESAADRYTDSATSTRFVHIWRGLEAMKCWTRWFKRDMSTVRLVIEGHSFMSRLHDLYSLTWAMEAALDEMDQRFPCDLKRWESEEHEEADPEKDPRWFVDSLDAWPEIPNPPCHKETDTEAGQYHFHLPRYQEKCVCPPEKKKAKK